MNPLSPNPYVTALPKPNGLPAGTPAPSMRPVPPPVVAGDRFIPSVALAPPAAVDMTPLSDKIAALKQAYLGSPMTGAQFQNLGVKLVVDAQASPLGERLEGLKTVYQAANSMSGDRYREVGVGLILGDRTAPVAERLDLLKAFYQGSNMQANEYNQLVTSVLTSP